MSSIASWPPPGNISVPPQQIAKQPGQIMSELELLEKQLELLASLCVALEEKLTPILRAEPAMGTTAREGGPVAYRVPLAQRIAESHIRVGEIIYRLSEMSGRLEL